MSGWANRAAPGGDAPGGGADAAFAESVAEGLSRARKALPCRYLYDAEGSRLFEEICAQPEYYVTRAETEVLETNAAAIVAGLPGPVDVAELGSGSAEKTTRLFRALLARQPRLFYVPVDISRSALETSRRRLERDFPRVRVSPIAAEYEVGLRRIGLMRDRPKLLLWLGSNIGNLDRDEAAAFLGRLRAACGPEDRLLVGFDLRKGLEVLLPAYDDPAGVTAAFDKNLLARINRELGGTFDLSAFIHRAAWNAQRGCIEMHLVSLKRQRVFIERIGREVTFEIGESIHTESSFKYSPDEIAAVAAAAGFSIAGSWVDGGGRFADVLLAPAA